MIRLVLTPKNLPGVLFFQVIETKGQQNLWEFRFLSYCLKAEFLVEIQGADTAESVNSCVMSETVKHAGDGMKRD